MLSTGATIVALLLAGWALLRAAMNRPPDRVQLAGTVVLTALVLALIVQAAVDWHPREPVTYLGYSTTALLLPPAAWLLARLEPTRYGSVIVGVAALIIPVLVLRMGQVWGAS